MVFGEIKKMFVMRLLLKVNMCTIKCHGYVRDKSSVMQYGCPPLIVAIKRESFQDEPDVINHNDNKIKSVISASSMMHLLHTYAYFRYIQFLILKRKVHSWLLPGE